MAIELYAVCDVCGETSKLRGNVAIMPTPMGSCNFRYTAPLNRDWIFDRQNRIMICPTCAAEMRKESSMEGNSTECQTKNVSLPPSPIPLPSNEDTSALTVDIQPSLPGRPLSE